MQMFKEACRVHRSRQSQAQEDDGAKAEDMSKEAEAAACKWFMFTLLPTYKDALESVAAGCLPGVNSDSDAKVKFIKHTVNCFPAINASFQAQ